MKNSPQRAQGSRSFISFIEGEAKPKTRTWEVWSRPQDEGGKDGGGGMLGEVKWYGPWRCYAFFAQAQTVFERKCLRGIATFCEEQTITHRSRPSASSAVKGGAA